jgi:hypothetical protein
MTPTAAPADRPALKVSVPVDDLARYAGLIGLVTGALAIAGVLASTAYLSAWHVPAPVIRLDPLTAALRSDSVLYQSLVLAAIVFGIDRLLRRLSAGSKVRAAALVILAGLVVLSVADSIRNGLLGPVITVVGGVCLLALHQTRRLGSRGTAVGFVLVVLAAAWQSGAETGILVRDGTAQRVSVSLTTRSQVAGLGGTESGLGWTYNGLYLVFRDGESVYVARGVERTIWVIPAGNVMSLGIDW